jgi:AraC-like DNA-binding protein
LLNCISTTQARFLRKLGDIAAHVSIVQASTGRFRHFTVDQPMIIRVRRGWKRAITAEFSLDTGSGQLVFLPQGLQCTIVNAVDAEGLYYCDAFALSPDLLDEFGKPERLAPVQPSKIESDPDFLDALDRAQSAIHADRSDQDKLNRHIIGELILRLQSMGIRVGVCHQPSLVQRIRTIVKQDPSCDWSSDALAARLAISPATLRRKLAAQATSLTDILADIRMTTALGLLQSTEMPINRIALDVGYESASKFAARFRSRFGLSPRDIRVPQAAIEQSGAEIERSGAAL